MTTITPLWFPGVAGTAGNGQEWPGITKNGWELPGISGNGRGWPGMAEDGQEMAGNDRK